MKIGRFWYAPSVDVEFTWAEVAAMISLSESHYDFLCREQSDKGFLNGMRNRMYAEYDGGVATWSPTAKINYRMDSDSADLLAKICERDPALCYKVVQIFRALNDKWLEMNPKPW